MVYKQEFLSHILRYLICSVERDIEQKKQLLFPFYLYLKFFSVLSVRMAGGGECLLKRKTIFLC